MRGITIYWHITTNKFCLKKQTLFQIKDVFSFIENSKYA